MDHLFLKKTPTTPQIDFRNPSKLTITGSLLPEDPKLFFSPIFSWFETTEATEIRLDIRLSYINTSSSKRIIELMKLIDKNTNLKRVDLNWHYETDDSDMLEFGELIQRNLKRIEVQYYETDDLSDDI